MRMLGRWPGSVRPSCGRGATRATPGNKYAGELDARDARRRDDVVGIGRRETDATQLVGHAKPPEDLHGAGADLPALHVRRVVRKAALGDDDINASPGQIHRQCQSHRATAYGQHPGPHTAKSPRGGARQLS